MKRIGLLTVVVLAGAAAFGQGNTCKYTFAFPQYSFQFCLTGDGTLAMLQSPIGVNHLDTVNPIEGWSWDLMGTVPHGGDVFFSGQQIPAFGSSSLGPPTVTHPNGAGTLPIRFDWHGFPADMWEIVTAQPGQRSVVLKVGVPPKGVWWGGTLTRVITLRLDGKTVNKFRRLRVGAFAYVMEGKLSSCGAQLGFALVPARSLMRLRARPRRSMATVRLLPKVTIARTLHL